MKFVYPQSIAKRRLKPYTYGDKVAVYYNLRRKCLSVCDARRGKPRRLLGHTDKINLKRVDFKVSQAGQARVRSQKRKNVHAFVVGTVCRTLPKSKQGFEPLTYNPYTHKGFTDNQGYIRNYADYAKVVGNKVFVPVEACDHCFQHWDVPLGVGLAWFQPVKRPYN